MILESAAALSLIGGAIAHTISVYVFDYDLIQEMRRVIDKEDWCRREFYKDRVLLESENPECRELLREAGLIREVTNRESVTNFSREQNATREPQHQGQEAQQTINEIVIEANKELSDGMQSTAVGVESALNGFTQAMEVYGQIPSFHQDIVDGVEGFRGGIREAQSAGLELGQGLEALGKVGREFSERVQNRDQFAQDFRGVVLDIRQALERYENFAMEVQGKTETTSSEVTAPLASKTSIWAVSSTARTNLKPLGFFPENHPAPE